MILPSIIVITRLQYFATSLFVPKNILKKSLNKASFPLLLSSYATLFCFFPTWLFHILSYFLFEEELDKIPPAREKPEERKGLTAKEIEEIAFQFMNDAIKINANQKSLTVSLIDQYYIDVYQKAPIKAITYYAEISKIDLYQDTGKYILYFNLLTH